MEKTNSFRFKIFGLLCTLLLCLGSLPAVGQNCPNFQWNDFTKSQMQPNSDCNTPGIVSIRYSNNIVGVDEVKYQFGSGPNGPWFETVDAPAPGATVKADIPASLSSVCQLDIDRSFVYAGQCSVLNVGINITLLIVDVEVVGHRAVARLFRRL